MLDLALLGSVAALAIAGTPHCVAMCAAPCAMAAGPGREQQAGFHAARVLSYAAVGALAAGSVGAMATWAPQAAMLRPLWVALHTAALGLGLWWLIRGQAAQRNAERRFGMSTQTAVVAMPAAGGGAAIRWQGVGRGVGAGALWAAWPCGLLHGALVVAALASSPESGAGLMAVFALLTSPGLIAGPWLLRRLGERWRRMAVRLAGGLLVAASVWALGHGLWAPFVAWCRTL